MKLQDLKLAMSPLTERIYIGTVSKDAPDIWSLKHDITSQFLGMLMAWCPTGTTRDIIGNNGKRYECVIREITEPSGKQPMEDVNQHTESTEEVKAACDASSPFQDRVAPWLQACFGAEIAADKLERNHRFLEEALELVQACGCSAHEARQLVDYVYGRPVGEPYQEVGGAMVTLAALCLANGLDMHKNAETELNRIWTKMDAIRKKQAAKPEHSPLPQ